MAKKQQRGGRTVLPDEVGAYLVDGVWVCVECFAAGKHSHLTNRKRPENLQPLTAGGVLLDMVNICEEDPDLRGSVHGVLGCELCNGDIWLLTRAGRERLWASARGWGDRKDQARGEA
jgi:hypothetical protein